MAVSIQYLLVGGGGGGGIDCAGGGGGGGVLAGTDAAVNPGQYAVAVGGGGAPGNPGTSEGAAGGNSTWNGHTAAGGGGGDATVGGQGGCGGGGGWFGARTGGAGSQGGNGGDGYWGGLTAAGGGGGGGGGNGAAAADGAAGNGGVGSASSISGASVTYAGGGGGGGENEDGLTFGVGGDGGGGDGNYENVPPWSTSGANGKGGGGGGSGSVYATPGSGGSGIVIVRFLTADVSFSTGGSKTTDGDYTVHTFTSNGTLDIGQGSTSESSSKSGSTSYSASLSTSSSPSRSQSGSDSRSSSTSTSRSGSLSSSTSTSKSGSASYSGSDSRSSSTSTSKSGSASYSGSDSRSSSTSTSRSDSASISQSPSASPSAEPGLSWIGSKTPGNGITSDPYSFGYYWANRYTVDASGGWVRKFHILARNTHPSTTFNLRVGVYDDNGLGTEPSGAPIVEGQIAFLPGGAGANFDWAEIDLSASGAYLAPNSIVWLAFRPVNADGTYFRYRNDQISGVGYARYGGGSAATLPNPWPAPANLLEGWQPAAVLTYEYTGDSPSTSQSRSSSLSTSRSDSRSQSPSASPTAESYQYELGVDTGAWSESAPGVAFGHSYTTGSGENGWGVKLHIFTRNHWAFPGRWEVGVYEHNPVRNQPGALIQSGLIDVPASFPWGWLEVALPNVYINGGETYWLIANSKRDAGATLYVADVTGSSSNGATADVGASLPSYFPNVTLSSFMRKYLRLVYGGPQSGSPSLSPSWTLSNSPSTSSSSSKSPSVSNSASESKSTSPSVSNSASDSRSSSTSTSKSGSLSNSASDSRSSSTSTSKSGSASYSASVSVSRSSSTSASYSASASATEEPGWYWLGSKTDFGVGGPELAGYVLALRRLVNSEGGWARRAHLRAKNPAASAATVQIGIYSEAVGATRPDRLIGSVLMTVPAGTTNYEWVDAVIDGYLAKDSYVWVAYLVKDNPSGFYTNRQAGAGATQAWYNTTQGSAAVLPAVFPSNPTITTADNALVISYEDTGDSPSLSESSSISQSPSKSGSLSSSASGSRSSSTSLSLSLEPGENIIGNRRPPQNGLSNDALATRVVTDAQGGYATEFWIYNSNPSSLYVHTLQLGIYADWPEWGRPGARIAYAELALPVLTPEGWYSTPISCYLAPNTTYWIAIGEVSPYATSLFYSWTTGSYSWRVGSRSGLEDPWSAGGTALEIDLSAYVVYGQQSPSQSESSSSSLSASSSISESASTSPSLSASASAQPGSSSPSQSESQSESVSTSLSDSSSGSASDSGSESGSGSSSESTSNSLSESTSNSLSDSSSESTSSSLSDSQSASTSSSLSESASSSTSNSRSDSSSGSASFSAEDFERSVPVADVDVGAWTNELDQTTDLWRSIGEPYPRDTTFIKSELAPNDSVVKFQMSPLYTPDVGPKILRIRGRWRT